MQYCNIYQIIVTCGKNMNSMGPSKMLSHHRSIASCRQPSYCEMSLTLERKSEIQSLLKYGGWQVWIVCFFHCPVIYDKKLYWKPWDCSHPWQNQNYTKICTKNLCNCCNCTYSMSHVDGRDILQLTSVHLIWCLKWAYLLK